jgi:hypothetical protein
MELTEEKVVIGSPAGIGICASASVGDMITDFSAGWCAGCGEAAGAIPDGGESKKTPAKYTKISNFERAGEGDPPTWIGAIVISGKWRGVWWRGCTRASRGG